VGLSRSAHVTETFYRTPLSSQPLGTQPEHTMKTLLSYIVLLLIVNITVVCAQDDPDVKLYNSINEILKKTFGPTYEAGAILVVDNQLKSEESSSGIYEDWNQQLQHSIIVLYSKWNSIDYGSGEELDDSGAIAIIRDNKIIWYSKSFILGYSQTASSFIGYSDLNGDGITDIICAIGGGSHLEMESLWIVSPNSQGGNLLNATYSNGYSSIIGAADTFEFIKIKGSKLKEIQVLDYASDDEKKFHYKWNGFSFSKINDNK
jgi:hypothetical protein